MHVSFLTRPRDLVIFNALLLTLFELDDVRGFGLIRNCSGVMVIGLVMGDTETNEVVVFKAGFGAGFLVGLGVGAGFFVGLGVGAADLARVLRGLGVFLLSPCSSVGGRSMSSNMSTPNLYLGSSSAAGVGDGAGLGRGWFCTGLLGGFQGGRKSSSSVSGGRGGKGSGGGSSGSMAVCVTLLGASCTLLWRLHHKMNRFL